MLKAYPTMPATVIRKRRGPDWTRRMTVRKERTDELQPDFLPVEPGQPTSYRRRSRAVRLVVPDTELPVLIMVTGYALWLSAVLIPSRLRPRPVRLAYGS